MHTLRMVDHVLIQKSLFLKLITAQQTEKHILIEMNFPVLHVTGYREELLLTRLTFIDVQLARVDQPVPIQMVKTPEVFPTEVAFMGLQPRMHEPVLRQVRRPNERFVTHAADVGAGFRMDLEVGEHLLLDGELLRTVLALVDALPVRPS